MSKLLINEPPLQVLPSLAVAIGLNEAIVLQQIHYWANNPRIGKTHEGRRWIYNSVRAWRQDNFPFWSEDTIRRTLESLYNQGVLQVANLNRHKYDRTLWYSIDQGQLDAIYAKCVNGIPQDAKMDSGNMHTPIPESTTETTTESEAPPAPPHTHAVFLGETPEELDTPAIKEALAGWEEHLRQLRKPMTPATRAALLKRLAGYAVQYGADATASLVLLWVERGAKNPFYDPPAATAPASGTDTTWLVVKSYARGTIPFPSCTAEMKELLRRMAPNGHPEELKNLKDHELKIAYHTARRAIKEK